MSQTLTEIHTGTEPLVFEHISLGGDQLLLEPLREEHFPELCSLIDRDIWKHYTHPIEDADDMRGYCERYFEQNAKKQAYAYVVRLRHSGQAVGSTRFLNVDQVNRVVEIGSTWFSKEFQRTFVNTESKWLMLTFAFEQLRCIGVRFQTDHQNHRSRQAMARIGAQFDGIVRYHRICHDGRVRHSAFYSIGADEWPVVKDGLEYLMTKYDDLMLT